MPAKTPTHPELLPSPEVMEMLGYEYKNGKLYHFCHCGGKMRYRGKTKRMANAVREWNCGDCEDIGVKSYHRVPVPKELYPFFGIETPLESLFQNIFNTDIDTSSVENAPAISSTSANIPESTVEALKILDSFDNPIRWISWDGQMWALVSQAMKFLGIVTSSGVTKAINKNTWLQSDQHIRDTPSGKKLHQKFRQCVPIEDRSARIRSRILSPECVLAIALNGKSERAKQIQSIVKNQEDVICQPQKQVEPKTIESKPVELVATVETDVNTKPTATIPTDTLCLDRGNRDSTIQRLNSGQAIQVINSVKCLFWAQWNDAQWLTVQQLADFLQMDIRAVQLNLERFRDEFEGEYRKLDKGDLKCFKLSLTNSEFVSESLVHPKAPHVNIFSPQGVLRMAMISDSSVATKVRDAIIYITSNLPKVAESVAISARKADMVPTEDVAQLVIAEYFNKLSNEVTHIRSQLSNSVPTTQATNEYSYLPIKRINQACADIELPNMFGPNNEEIWIKWDGSEEVKILRPVLYAIFVDIHRRGKLTHIFSVGEGGIQTGRVSTSHERIKMLVERQYNFRVLYLPLEDEAFKLKSKRKEFESMLQNELKPLWDVLWDDQYKRQFKGEMTVQ